MNRINTNRPFLARFSQLLCTIVACSGLIGPGNVLLLAQTSPPDPAAASATQFAKIPAEQLDALVAPIALYPDPLLSQTLVASTYPVELMQLHQWLVKNPGLKDQ